MAQIIYRSAQESDAKKIVRFYNYVGGETSFLSFERDEYPLNAEEQEKELRSLAQRAANIMLLAMDGEEIAGIATIHSSSKISSRVMMGNSASSLPGNIRDRGSAQS